MVPAPRIKVIDNQGNKFGALGHLKTSSSDGDASAGSYR